MDLSIRLKTLDNVKHRHTLCLKFGDIFFTSLMRLVLEVKGGICFTLQENLLLCCRKFSAFVIAVII